MVSVSCIYVTHAFVFLSPLVGFLLLRMARMRTSLTGSLRGHRTYLPTRIHTLGIKRMLSCNWRRGHVFSSNAIYDLENMFQALNTAWDIKAYICCYLSLCMYNVYKSADPWPSACESFFTTTATTTTATHHDCYHLPLVPLTPLDDLTTLKT